MIPDTHYITFRFSQKNKFLKKITIAKILFYLQPLKIKTMRYFLCLIGLVILLSCFQNIQEPVSNSVNTENIENSCFESPSNIPLFAIEISATGFSVTQTNSYNYFYKKLSFGSAKVKSSGLFQNKSKKLSYPIFTKTSDLFLLRHFSQILLRAMII